MDTGSDESVMRQAFPNLAREGYVQTSPASPDYNCIAWAAGEDDRKWWPDPAFIGHWPAKVPRAETMDAFVQAFATLGYEPCDDGVLEGGFEKVAIYATHGSPTHAARQLADGTWTSKLGDYIDITHTLAGLEGPQYGSVARFMKRPVQRDSTSSSTSPTKSIAPQV